MGRRCTLNAPTVQPSSPQQPREGEPQSLQDHEPETVGQRHEKKQRNSKGVSPANFAAAV